MQEEQEREFSATFLHADPRTRGARRCACGFSVVAVMRRPERPVKGIEISHVHLRLWFRRTRGKFACDERIFLATPCASPNEGSGQVLERASALRASSFDLHLRLANLMISYDVVAGFILGFYVGFAFSEFGG